MTKQVRRITAGIAAAAMVFCMGGYFPQTATQLRTAAAFEVDWTVHKEGKCGENLTWTYDSDLSTYPIEGVMTISGEGEMTAAPEFELDAYGSGDYSGSVRTLIIEEGVTTIADGAFSRFSALEEVSLPQSLTRIGSRAFEASAGGITKTGFTKVTIPDNVTYIGENAFAFCSALKSVKLPANLETLGDGAFEWCSGLTEIELPDTITSIGENAFMKCTGLTKLVLPDSLTSLGAFALSECQTLAEITFPENLTNFGKCCFRGTAWLDAAAQKGMVVVNGVLVEPMKFDSFPLSVPDGVKIIAENALDVNTLTAPSGKSVSGKYNQSFVIPESITEIHDLAFWDEDNESDELKEQITLYGVPGSYAQTWAEANGVTFKNVKALDGNSTELKKTLVGDVNADGTVSVSDVVLLQKWLLAVPDTHLDNWRNADMNDDWELDVFDLCLMKRALLDKTPADTSGEYVLHTAETKDIEWETYSDFSVNMQIPKGWAVSCTTPKDDMFALRYEVTSPDHDCRIVYMVSDPNTWYNSKEYATNLAESMRNDLYTEVQKSAEYVRWLTESSTKGWCEGSADYGNSTFEILDEVKLNEVSYYENTKQFHQYDVARIHGKRTTKEGKIYEGLYRAGVYGPENSEPKTNPITGELWDYPNFTVNGVRIMEAPADEFDSWLPVLQKSLYSLEFTDEYKSMLSTAVSAKSAALGDMIGDTVSVAKYSDATLGYERVYDNDTGDIYMAYSGFLEDRAKLGDDRFTAATDTMYTQTISGWIEEK